MIQKIIINYRKLSDGDFVAKVQCIINALTGNPDYTDPIPTLADLQTALGTFILSLPAASQGSKPDIVIKDQNRIALQDLVRQLGLFVMYIANGNVTMLAGSGFDLAKARSSQNLATPGAVKLRDGISTGMLTSSIPKPAGSRGCIHELTADPITQDSQWQTVVTSSVSHTFENLTAGKKYWARVGAIGKKGEIAYSNLYLSKFVQ